MIKINSKVIWFNLIVIVGMILDYVIPHMSDYQPFLSAKTYTATVLILNVINIILRVVRPSIQPIEKVNSDAQ